MNIKSTPTVEELLLCAAESLQDYCEQLNGDMNDSLAMKIYAWLDARKAPQTDLD